MKSLTGRCPLGQLTVGEIGEVFGEVKEMVEHIPASFFEAIKALLNRVVGVTNQSYLLDLVL